MSASPRHPQARLLPWAAAILVLGVYGWMASLGTGRFDFRAPRTDLYTRLVEAFAAGHVHLLDRPSPELLRLPDPYDSAQNSAFRLLDASLYHGNYYVYFGVTPVLLWLWPYYALSGCHPPQGLTVLVFCGAAFLAGCLLIDRLHRVHFPGLTSAAQALGVLVWGLGNFSSVLLCHHDFFEIAVASGLCCLVAMLCCLHAVITAPPGRGVGAMAAASVFYGLAVGSRPNLIFTGALFALVLSFAYRRSRRMEGRLWAAAAWPATVILIGLFAYNYERFGNPWEFGMHYQLAGPDRSTFTAFAWRYVPFNAHYYFLSIPRLSLYFPFILGPAASWGKPAAGHEGVYGVVGSLWACPFVLFAAAAFWSGRVARQKGAEIRGFSLLLLAAFAAVSAVLVGIGFCVYRYMAESLAPLLLLAVVGWMALGSIRGRPWLRAGLMLAGGLALAWTAAVNLLLGASVEGMYRAQNPAQYAQVARTLNGPVGRLAQAMGWHPLRPVISLRFPSDRIGTLAPLLVAGTPPAADFLYVFYVAPNLLQIGFEAMGLGGPVGGLIPVDTAAPHTLEIEGGWFLPPPGNPWTDEHAGVKTAVLQHSLVVTLDGKVVLDGYADFHDNQQRFRFGHGDESNAFGGRFIGPLFKVSWVAERATFADDRFDRKRYGAAILSLNFSATPRDQAEPLLTTGSRNRALLVTATCRRGDRIEFALLRSGQSSIVSAPVRIDRRHDVRVVISVGSLYPTADNPLWTQSPVAAASRLGRYRIEVSGRTVIAGNGEFYAAPPSTVVVGENSAGFSSVSPAFVGRIALVGRDW